MKKIRIALLLFVAIALAACNTRAPQTAEESPYARLLDSILQQGLDNEALYTLLSDMKPISSLRSVTICMDDLHSSKEMDSTRMMPYVSVERLEEIQRAANSINLPDLKIVAIPYRDSGYGRRSVAFSIVRISALDRLLEEKSDFFGRLGLVPGADPSTVVNTIEYSDKFDRWRGYGYLFGYPDYAVDFYVNSEAERERTGKFVERDFFRMYTYDGVGNFVYAYPKGDTPTAEVDSVIYYKAARILESYKLTRDSYLREDQSVRARDLIFTAGQIAEVE